MRKPTVKEINGAIDILESAGTVVSLGFWTTGSCARDENDMSEVIDIGAIAAQWPKDKNGWVTATADQRVAVESVSRCAQ